MGAAYGVWAADLPEAKYETPPFSKYQPILDRLPFGQMASPGETVDPEAAKTDAEVRVEQEKLSKQVKMSCVNISPEGETMVGFTDLSDKIQKTFYLAVGESRDGWTIIDADYDKEWATIKKDDIEVTMQLGKGMVDDSKTKGANGTQPAMANPVMTQPRIGFGGTRSGSPFIRSGFPMRNDQNNTPAASIGRSFTERLKERQARQSADREARDKANREAMLKLAHEAAQAEIARQKKEDAEAEQRQQQQQQQQLQQDPGNEEN